MEYKKRIKIKLGENPHHPLRQVVLMSGVILFLLGVVQLANSLNAQIRPSQGCLARVSGLVEEQFKSAGFSEYSYEARQEKNRLCQEEKKRKYLNLGFYLTVPGAVIIVISLFLP